MLDLYKELQTRDPNKSNIFKTLEFQYEKSPDIVDKLLLQFMLKATGLGAITYLIPKINIYGLSIEEFFKNNLYKKFNHLNNQIENLMESKKPEDVVFKLNLIKFFDLMFSENCSLFDINYRLFNNFNQWVQEISQCKVNIVRLQILEIAEILFSSGGKYLKMIQDQHSHEKQRAKESIATYFIQKNSQASQKNEKKQETLEKKIQKIKTFLNEILSVIIQRQMDQNQEVRHKSVGMFVNCVKFLPQLFLQNQYLLEHFNLVDGIDIKLRLIVCKNMIELFKISKVQQNEFYLKEILQTCQRVKRQLMINFNEKDLKYQSEFYVLLGDILENDSNFLDQNEKKMIISLIISKISINSCEMRIIQLLFFGKNAIREDFSQDLFMHQKEENYNIILNQLFTFIQEINLINNEVFKCDEMIMQVVKNLYQQKMSIVLSFPVIIDALSLDKHFNGSKKYNQLILIKILVYSIQECINLKNNLHQKKDQDKFQKLHDIFDKSLQSSCLKILNRLKDLQQEDEISMFLQLFSFIQCDNQVEEFQVCLNQIINSSQYYFTLSTNTQVYERISKLVCNLRERKQPALEQVINNFTDKLLQHMINQIDTQSQQAHQIFQNEPLDTYLVSELQEKFLHTMHKITIFTQNNINYCDFQWEQINKLWHLCYVLHVNSNNVQIDLQTIISCNKLLYNTFTSYLQRLLTQYNPTFYQEFNSVKTAILEDCKNFLKNMQSLMLKFGHDQIIILLDQFYYHLTQTLEILFNQEYSSINPIYINPYSDEFIELNQCLCEYMQLFGETQSKNAEIMDDINRFKQTIQEKIAQEDPFYFKKLHQMMLQSLKIVHISSEIGQFSLVNQLGIIFFDSKIDCIRRYMYRYWQILKQKEVSQDHQNILIFWRVALNGIDFFLNQKNDKQSCLRFCQIIKKNFPLLEKFPKNQIEISKQKYALFILKGIEEFSKQSQLYFGFEVLQQIMDENKQILGIDTYKRIFAFLLSQIQNQQNILGQNSQEILQNSPDFQYVLNFSDFMMLQARLKKIQNSDDPVKPDEASSQEINNVEIPQNLTIKKNNSSVNFSRTTEYIVQNSGMKSYNNLDETKKQLNFSAIENLDQFSGSKLKKQ